MTQDNSANVSSVKESFITNAMRHNCLMNCKENIKLIIVQFVLHFAGAPLVLLMLLINILTYGSDDVEAYLVIGTLTTGAGALSGIICALSAMPYLYRKHMVDMRLSLPMTTTERFVSDYFSGLVTYIAPFLSAQVFTWIFMLIGHVACDNKVFYDERYNYSDYEGWYCTIFSDVAPILLKATIGAVLLMLMFYALTVIVSDCCGSVFECVAYTAMANGLIPGVIAIIIAVSISSVSGLDEEVYIRELIPYTSPIGGAIGLVMAFSNDAYLIENGTLLPNPYTFGTWFIGVFIAVIIYTLAAFFIYKKRRAEDTGKPIVFGLFYHIIVTMGIVSIVFIFMDDGELIVPMIIITAILYMVFHVVRNRGFAKFGKGVLTYVITLLSCCAAYFVVAATAFFGIADYVPSVSSVSEVYISYNGYFENASYYDFGGFDYYANDDASVFTIKDPENIAIVTEAHKIMTEDDYIHDTYNYSGETIRIMYKLKSGRYVVREFECDDAEMEVLARLDRTEEFKEYYANYVSNKFIQAKRTYEEGLASGDSVKNYYVSVAPKWMYEGYDYSDSRDMINYAYLPADFFDKMQSAMYNDLKNQTDEDYFRYEGKQWFISASGMADVIITQKHTQSIAYLTECGFELPDVSVNTLRKYQTEGFEQYITSQPLESQIAGKQILSNTEGRNVRIKFGGFQEDVMYYSQFYCGSEEYMKLMEVAQKAYKADDSSYTIIVGGSKAVIPIEYKPLAEEFYIRSVVGEFMHRLGADFYQYCEVFDLTVFDIELRKNRSYNKNVEFFDEYDTNCYREFMGEFAEFYGKQKFTEIFGNSDLYEAITEYSKGGHLIDDYSEELY